MKCSHCKTHLNKDDRADVYGGNFHVECAARLGIGTVGHQLRRCPCFRGTYENPPGYTEREAAIASYWLNVGRHMPVPVPAPLLRFDS